VIFFFEPEKRGVKGLGFRVLEAGEKGQTGVKGLGFRALEAGVQAEMTDEGSVKNMNRPPPIPYTLYPKPLVNIPQPPAPNTLYPIP
jgi:hypothetical protein